MKEAKFREKKKYFISSGKEEENRGKEWFTVKECLGLPGFREASLQFANVCISTAKGKEGSERKRVKSKAEVSYICFPSFMFIVILTTARKAICQNPFSLTGSGA